MNIKIEKVKLLDDLHISSENSRGDYDDLDVHRGVGIAMQSPKSSVGGGPALGSSIMMTRLSPTSNAGNQANLDEPTIDPTLEEPTSALLSSHKKRMQNRMTLEDQARLLQ